MKTKVLVTLASLIAVSVAVGIGQAKPVEPTIKVGVLLNGSGPLWYTAAFEKAGAESRIMMHVGDARQIIPMINETWDLVFIDADKVGYIDYYELTLPKVRQGGWILADNVFFHGLIFDNPISGKNAIAIRDFNNHIAEDSRVEQVMLSIRDGLMLIRKK